MSNPKNAITISATSVFYVADAHAKPPRAIHCVIDGEDLLIPSTSLSYAQQATLSAILTTLQKDAAKRAKARSHPHKKP